MKAIKIVYRPQDWQDKVDSKICQAKLKNHAARVIQRTWRCHVDVQIFKYYKKLVSFRNQGDPRLLLKYVNPREADILDAASGVYIRFRLGGITFPPNIYYKIFTHRPIVDMCANSPRDYTHPGCKMPVPKQKHNKMPFIQEDHAGWYQRVENNGWRLLSGKTSLLGDFVTTETGNKKMDFSHCKLQRRQDVDRKKKKRKFDWLKKMYEQGCLHANTKNKETAKLVESSTQGLMLAAEQQGANQILEWEVNELLEWTNALNFDEYMFEWKGVGTSRSSMRHKDECMTLIEPYESSVLSESDSQMISCLHQCKPIPSPHHHHHQVGPLH